MTSIYDTLPRPFMVLAPMDDVTETAFRQVIQSTAPPDLFFTEFVNVDGLVSAGRSRLLPKLKFSKAEKPIIAQLWGSKPENFREIASQLKDIGFAGIDLNMGCPDKTIVKNGCCSALINNHDLAAEIINQTIVGANLLPVSVKTRIGFNEVDLTWFDFLFQFDLAAITVHGRTKKQMSKVPADWEKIGQVRQMRDDQKSPTLIIGNGDVNSRLEAETKAIEYKLDGIMIGRGALKDPYVFMSDSQWLDMTKAKKIELFKKHIELFADSWPNQERRVNQLFKFAKLYLNNFDGASDIRNELMTVKDTDAALKILEQQLLN